MSKTIVLLISTVPVSLLCLFLAIYFYKTMSKCNCHCEAVVDSIVINSNGQRAPVFKYQTETETITRKHMVSSRPMNKFKEGDIVDLYYNPAKPTQFILENGSPYKLLTIIFMAAAIFSLLISVMLSFAIQN